MYALISAGGRQLKVEPGQEVQIDYRGAKSGEQITFDQVLVYSDGQQTQVGQPQLSGVRVTGQVVRTVQGPKLTIRKFKRRKGYRRKTGHRQLYNTVRITEIVAG